MTTIFILQGRVNFTNLSRYSELSEKTYRRQFAKPFPFGQCNRAGIEEVIPESHPLVAVMDASYIPKSGKHTDGLDYFYNGCHQRVEKGLELSLIGVVDVETEQAYALDAQQTLSRKQTQTSESWTRMQDYIAHLEAVHPLLPERVKYLLVDGYYVKEDFLQTVLGLKLDVISKLRQDANLRYLFTGEQKGRGRKRLYDGKVNLSDLSRLTHVCELQPGVDLYTAIVWYVRGKRRIRLACVYDRRDPAKPTYALLFSTDLNQDPQEIYRFYCLRFQIEFLFRDAKQFTGLTHCQARDAQKLYFHFNASFMALNLAKFQLQPTLTKDTSFSMNNVKRKAFNHYFLDLIFNNLDLDSTLLKSHPNYPKLLELGAIVA